MGSECKECERLWREYAAAKKSCLVLMSKLRIATFSHDAESIRELPPSSIAPEQPPRNARGGPTLLCGGHCRQDETGSAGRVSDTSATGR